MPLQNQYGGSGGVMFNPNETEEEKRARYQAEALRSSVSDAQVASQQSEYDRLMTQGAGPQGRTVGSRNTFVAASPFEHIAEVAASYIKGKKAKKVKGELETSLAKQATSRAADKADKRIKSEELVEIKKAQADQLGEHYKALDSNAKERIANDVLKMEETKANNIRRNEAAMSKLDKRATEFRPTTQGERSKVSNMRFGINSVSNAGETFKDSYARPLGGASIISDAATAIGTTLGVDPTGVVNLFSDSPEEVKEGESSNFQDAARWLAGWKQGYTLWQRNELFGATLTPSEQKAWNSAGEINLNMDPTEIRKRVSQAEQIMRKRADASAFTGITAGQNPKMWQGMTSQGFDPATFGQEMAAPAQPGAPTGLQGPVEPNKVYSYKDYMDEDE